MKDNKKKANECEDNEASYNEKDKYIDKGKVRGKVKKNIMIMMVMIAIMIIMIIMIIVW